MSDDRVRQWNSTLSASKSKLGAWRDRSRKPLARTAELKTHTPLKHVNRERKAKRKAEGEVYGSYHRWVETQPCILANHPDHECRSFAGRKPIEGHHLKRVGNGGKDAENEISACPLLHDMCHGAVKGWTEKDVEERFAVDLDLEAAALWGKYTDET